VDETRLREAVAAEVSRVAREQTRNQDVSHGRKRAGQIWDHFPALQQHEDTVLKEVDEFSRKLRSLFFDDQGVWRVPPRGTPEYAAWQQKWDALQSQTIAALSMYFPNESQADTFVKYVTGPDYQRNQ
jgi:hypothetical protein